VNAGSFRALLRVGAVGVYHALRLDRQWARTDTVNIEEHVLRALAHHGPVGPVVHHTALLRRLARRTVARVAAHVADTHVRGRTVPVAHTLALHRWQGWDRSVLYQRRFGAVAEGVATVAWRTSAERGVIGGCALGTNSAGGGPAHIHAHAVHFVACLRVWAIIVGRTSDQSTRDFGVSLHAHWTITLHLMDKGSTHGVTTARGFSVSAGVDTVVVDTRSRRDAFRVFGAFGFEALLTGVAGPARRAGAHGAVVLRGAQGVGSAGVGHHTRVHAGSVETRAVAGAV